MKAWALGVLGGRLTLTLTHSTERCVCDGLGVRVRVRVLGVDHAPHHPSSRYVHQLT